MSAEEDKERGAKARGAQAALPPEPIAGGAEPSEGSAQELREAEALAAALEGRAAGATGPAPTDALETATLLRHARGAAPLPADLEARVADRALSDLGVRR